MALIQITSREFRENQAKFFEMADKGDNIIISRRKKQSYTLTPIDQEQDLSFTPEMLEKIDRSLQEAQQGYVKRFNTTKELDDYLKNL